MPAFTFEKISPPVHHSPPSPAPQKPRGIIIQILDRFVEARARKSLRKERRAVTRGKPKSAD